MYDLPVVVTAIALTVYQVMNMLLVLPGGMLADRVKNTEMVLGVCFGAGAVLVVIAGLGTLPFWLAVCVLGTAGALRGLVNASRDVSVRHAAGEGISVATVFAFVSTGFSLGQMMGPTLYGWLIDTGSPQSVFWVSAGFSVMSLVAMLIGQLVKPRTAGAVAE
jgi:MFS family permease